MHSRVGLQFFILSQVKPSGPILITVIQGHCSLNGPFPPWDVPVENYGSCFHQVQSKMVDSADSENSLFRESIALKLYLQQQQMHSHSKYSCYIVHIAFFLPLKFAEHTRCLIKVKCSLLKCSMYFSSFQKPLFIPSKFVRHLGPGRVGWPGLDLMNTTTIIPCGLVS